MAKRKPPVYREQEMFFLDVQRPWKPVKRGIGETKLTDKCGMFEPAKRVSMHQRSYTVGVSAFYRYEDAAKARVARLRKIVDDRWLRVHRSAGWEMCRRELMKESTDGTA